MRVRKKTSVIIFSALLALAVFITGCQQATGSSVDSAEVENLAKLCKVWGYVKYRHPVFLHGEKDWDEELVSLIPQVREAENSEEVNELLHDWFVSLGEVDYGMGQMSALWTMAAEEDKVVLADTAWTADTGYLGEALTADLAQVSEPIYGADHVYAPAVNLNFQSTNFFASEPEHEAAYKSAEFRLLGLFRLWNAMEYYFPYLDLLDESWESYLEVYIPRILEGRDRTSYESTIAALAFRLHDGHGFFTGADGLRNMLGKYYLPNVLDQAEGRLVVVDTVEGSPLEPGDVLVAVNGKDIETLMEERKEYLSYPRDESALEYLAYGITRSKRERIRVTVLRDGEEQALTVKGIRGLPNALWPDPESVPAYQILDGNIGLINPGVFASKQTAEAMDALRGTKGLIVDLRQYPNTYNVSREVGMSIMGLSNYLGVANETFLVYGEASVAVPGTYVKRAYSPTTFDGTGITRIAARSPSVYQYEQPVVVLMESSGIGTQSSAEMTVQMFLAAENTVTMGEPSAGANGGIAYLPLPGGLTFEFSGRRVYMPDGEVTQRVGITPAILVEPTIQGIKDGRDEVLEAAIEYIKNT